MKMNKELNTIILGDEHDDALRDALRATLVSCGAVEINNSWAVGGSQEIEKVQIKLGSASITVESETFIGLTISGPKLIVDDIAKKVRQQLDV